MRALAIALCLVSLPVAADTPQANPHFQAAVAAYEAKDFVTARNEFALAYEVEASPAVLWSWAQAERLSGRCEKALPLYRKYLDSASTPEKIKYTTEYIDLCERVAPEPWYKNKLGGALTLAGTVGVGVGIAFMVASANTRSGADNAMYLDEFEQQLGVATDQRRIGAVALGLGAALIAGGVMIYISHKREQESRIVAGTDGRTVFVGAQF